MSDPYTDPRSGVLRNRLGIADRDGLSQAEADLTTAAMAALIDTPLPGAFDLVHLQAFHRRIFGRIYPLTIRTVAIAKTDMFCLPHHIEGYASSTFEDLARDKHLRGLPRDSFVDRLTHYFAEVNAIHPFLEGNGRCFWARDCGARWRSLLALRVHSEPFSSASSPERPAGRSTGPS